MIWAEGFLDRLAAETLATRIGFEIDGPVRDAGGGPAFWASIEKYNAAARQCGLVFALADHDSIRCVGAKIKKKVPNRHGNLVLRLCVAELESWLLADADALAKHLSVSPGKIPREPDREIDPKRKLVAIASGSSKPSIRQGMVPKPGFSSVCGPEYSNIVAEFINQHWRPRRAAERSPSLNRAIAALERAAKQRPQSSVHSDDSMCLCGPTASHPVPRACRQSRP